MIVNTLIFILLFCWNISFLDRLLLSRKAKWIPFFENPKKWYYVLMADEDEAILPTPFKGNYSINANYTGNINETAEETERKKEFFRQKMAQDTLSHIKYISEFESKQVAKKIVDDEWLEKVQFHGCATIVLNFAFIVFLVFYQPVENSQKSNEQERPEKLEGQHPQRPGRLGG